MRRPPSRSLRYHGAVLLDGARRLTTGALVQLLAPITTLLLVAGVTLIPFPMALFSDLEPEKCIGASLDFEDCFDIDFGGQSRDSSTTSMLCSQSISIGSLVCPAPVRRPKYTPEGRQTKKICQECGVQ